MEENKNHIEETGKENNTKHKAGKGTVIALVIVIILAIAAVVGTWYYMNNKAKNDKKARDAQIQELQKQVDDLKNKGIVNDADMVSYEIVGTPLALKYPKGWYTLACPRQQGDKITIDFLASAKEYLGVCNSDATSQISIATSKNANNLQEPTGWSSTNVNINGINMKRLEAPANRPYAPGSDYIFVKDVRYEFNKNGTYYSVNYVQTNKTPDVYSDFEKIVNSITVN